MQFVAVYTQSEPSTGPYIAHHDPFGSTKDMTLTSDPTAQSVLITFDHPVPEMGKPFNRFVMSGEVVWQLLTGDWFDAAMIYKKWVIGHARWWPRHLMEPDTGRTDTPLWMRELCIWVSQWYEPEIDWCVGRPATVDERKAVIARLQQYLGVPLGVHWYGWHQIPFDDDYPHFLPPKDGFVQCVSDLRDIGVHNMPYINGRLWDTHDRGDEDFEFSQVALPAATKRDDGSSYLEFYGRDFAVMCPFTSLWQMRVRDLVNSVVSVTGADGVYVDQVAAACPVLCMDESHSHPLGGGNWWNEGYWHMLRAIRGDLPSEVVITTEGNAEPFVGSFDGDLSFRWMYDGMVPAFPAVYGGAVQMFGRIYGGPPVFAFRMILGQQLVFGEQFGHFCADVVDNPETIEFLLKVVRLRWQLRQYFYGGEMARPPKLSGAIPAVSGNWTWDGNPNWVTTDAVLTGAWTLPHQGKLVFLFANVSEEAVEATLRVDLSAYGMQRAHAFLTVVDPISGSSQPVQVPRRFERTANFDPLSATAWEISMQR